MKKLVTLLVALSGVTFAAPKVAACDYSVVVVYAAPYRVSTWEVGRCSYCKTTYDRCGNSHSYSVTVVTYRDFYSDGTYRTYTRSFRA